MKIYNYSWEAFGFKSYGEFLLSDLWKEKREWIISCKGKKCEYCGSKNNLCVHHLHYENVGNESSKDVLVLCYDCHQKIHMRGDKGNDIC